VTAAGLSLSYTARIILRIVLATICGGLIGLERGTHGQAAGPRTFSLVCLGSCLATITDEYLIGVYGSGDPARISAQVISGVGFLGVGTIIVTGKNNVKGLTTAAGLWTTACLGIAFGAGFLSAAIAAMAMFLFVMTAFSSLSKWADDNAKELRCYMEIDKTAGIDAVYRFFRNSDYRIKTVDKQQKKQALRAQDIAIILSIDLHRMTRHDLVIDKMYAIPEVHYIEEIR